jgi:hypothetical protein
MCVRSHPLAPISADLVPWSICVNDQLSNRGNIMGRPIGSPNREKPFRQALNIALHSRPLTLRRIADRLLDSAEQGDLPAAREIIDRLDGRPAQSVEYGHLPAAELTDRQLHEIAGRGWTEGYQEPKALPAPRKLSGA